MGSEDFWLVPGSTIWVIRGHPKRSEDFHKTRIKRGFFFARGSATKIEVTIVRSSNFALRLQPSLLEELRSMSDLEGVAVNQLINVAIAEKLSQMRTGKWFADRIAAAGPKAGAQLIRDLSRGGGEKPRKGDVIVIGKIRSQFKKDPLIRENIDVNEIMRETVVLLRSEAVRYKILVRTELAADPLQIVGDRVLLQQVPMNLIINSIEAMKDIDGPREMSIRSQRGDNEQILVSVSDTGVGFPPQLAEQIFDPFFTKKPQGTGMGLRLSRSIIESHSGRLWAVGNPGRGATFHLSLPAAPKAPQ
jgi:signal transduction histidine kinase